MELKDKRAIVTGVSKGIGKATVLDLLERGARVVGWGRNSGDISHERFTFLQTDIRDAGSVAGVFEKTMELLAGIDILVNNAGLGIFKTMEELTDQDIDDMFKTNVYGIFHACRHVIPAMKEQQSGHIVNIASTAGLMGIEEASAYCGTKFAVRGITETMYKELKPFKIKVTCIYPGAVNTDFFEQYPGITANETMMDATDISKAIIDVLESRSNVAPMNVELRPLNAKYR